MSISVWALLGPSLQTAYAERYQWEQDFPEIPYEGPMDDETYAIMNSFADLFVVGPMYESVPDEDDEIFRMYGMNFIDEVDAIAAMDYLLANWPGNQINILGAWDKHTGLQMGLSYDDSDLSAYVDERADRGADRIVLQRDQREFQQLHLALANVGLGHRPRRNQGQRRPVYLEGDMREVDLYQPVKAELQRYGYDVYAEVQWPVGTSSIDVVGLNGHRPPVIVELKTGFTAKLAYQCLLAQLVTPFVYAAAPTKPSLDFLHRAAKGGFGVARVVKELVTVVQKPRIRKRRWPGKGPVNEYARRIIRACRDGAAWHQAQTGGVPTQCGTGPAQTVWRAIRDYRRRHPRARWQEIFERVPNHYAHARSMQGAMRVVSNIRLGRARRLRAKR